jgi:hypothetical protein
VSPKNAYLPKNVTIFRDRAFTEVVR